jgi:hypothetical protein
MRRVVERGAVGPARAPAVLGSKQVAEQLVADDEQRIDVEGAVLEVHLGQGRVLDELARLARVEHAVEILALAKLDRLGELGQENGIVRQRRFIDGRERTPRARFVGGGAAPRLDQRQTDCRPDGQAPDRDPQPPPSPLPSRALLVSNAAHQRSS